MNHTNKKKERILINMTMRGGESLAMLYEVQ